MRHARTPGGVSGGGLSLSTGAPVRQLSTARGHGRLPRSADRSRVCCDGSRPLDAALHPADRPAAPGTDRPDRPDRSDAAPGPPWTMACDLDRLARPGRRRLHGGGAAHPRAVDARTSRRGGDRLGVAAVARRGLLRRERGLLRHAVARAAAQEQRRPFARRRAGDDQPRPARSGRARVRARRVVHDRPAGDLRRSRAPGPAPARCGGALHGPRRGRHDPARRPSLRGHAPCLGGDPALPRGRRAQQRVLPLRAGGVPLPALATRCRVPRAARQPTGVRPRRSTPRATPTCSTRCRRRGRVRRCRAPEPRAAPARRRARGPVSRRWSRVLHRRRG